MNYSLYNAIFFIIYTKIYLLNLNFYLLTMPKTSFVTITCHYGIKEVVFRTCGHFRLLQFFPFDTNMIVKNDTVEMMFQSTHNIYYNTYTMMSEQLYRALKTALGNIGSGGILVSNLVTA